MDAHFSKKRKRKKEDVIKPRTSNLFNTIRIPVKYFYASLGEGNLWIREIIQREKTRHALYPTRGWTHLSTFLIALKTIGREKFGQIYLKQKQIIRIKRTYTYILIIPADRLITNTWTHRMHRVHQVVDRCANRSRDIRIIISHPGEELPRFVD